MQCYVCDRRGRARGFRHFADLENVTQKYLENALERRTNLGFPPRNIQVNDVIHNNCHRQIMDAIDAEDDDNRFTFKCIVQRRNECFICGNDRRNLVRLSFKVRLDMYIYKEIYAPRASFCCQEHLGDDDMIPKDVIDGLDTNERQVGMTPQEVTEWFKALREHAVQSVTNHFDSEENFSDEDFKTITSLSKHDFRNLYNHCEATVVYGKTRSISKKDLITFLFKLKQDLSDEVLKVLFFYNSRQLVSLIVTAVRICLSQRFVSENLGPTSITREVFINEHVTDFANELYNTEPDQRKAIIYIDGTYLKIPKSSNFRALRQSYCLHKGYHLIKPVLVVAPDGFILDVHGPYFSDSRNNDAAILQHHMENERLEDITRLRDWLEEDDIIIVDRGYRDSVNFLNDLGMECKMPPLLPRGERQYSTEEANNARLITKTRWIVEARNGHLKSIFKFFRGQIGSHHIPHIGSFFRIACAIINAYFPPVHMQGATVQLAQAMNELADFENVVRARVEVERLHLQRIQDDVWTNLDEFALHEFPVLSLQYLRDITIGVYQLKLSPSYIQDRLQRENVEHFTFQGTLIEDGLLRARIYSRFTQRTKHQLWIAFEPGANVENDGNSIIGYYCTCKVGSRTVGCCAHVASVLWYLGYARHQPNLRYPSTRLLHSVLDAAERELPQN